MVYRALITLMLLISISGCASVARQSNTLLDKPVLMKDIDTANVDAHFKEQKTFGYVQPYIPVVQEPVVRKVWVPDLKSNADPDVLIAGHWAYVMVRGPKWVKRVPSTR